METGGMKGMRKELVRSALHKKLKDRYKVTEIHSEYGMTELLSKAYSKGKGIFKCPQWMKVMSRSIEDPFETSESDLFEKWISPRGRKSSIGDHYQNFRKWERAEKSKKLHQKIYGN